MLIRSLEEMEKIVKDNDNLIWDGWTVVSLKPIDSGLMSKNTILIENQWYVQKRYDLTENGWELPIKIVG